MKGSTIRQVMQLHGFAPKTIEANGVVYSRTLGTRGVTHQVSFLFEPGDPDWMRDPRCTGVVVTTSAFLPLSESRDASGIPPHEEDPWQVVRQVSAQLGEETVPPAAVDPRRCASCDAVVQDYVGGLCLTCWEDQRAGST